MKLKKIFALCISAAVMLTGCIQKNDDVELSEEEKEFKSKRKEIQEKLIKFATRIPIFMYLTDFREKCLKDALLPSLNRSCSRK